MRWRSLATTPLHRSPIARPPCVAVSSTASNHRPGPAGKPAPPGAEGAPAWVVLRCGKRISTCRMAFRTRASAELRRRNSGCQQHVHSQPVVILAPLPVVHRSSTASPTGCGFVWATPSPVSSPTRSGLLINRERWLLWRPLLPVDQEAGDRGWPRRLARGQKISYPVTAAISTFRLRTSTETNLSSSRFEHSRS